MYTHIYIYIYIHMSICIYIYIYIYCIHVHLCVFICLLKSHMAACQTMVPGHRFGGATRRRVGIPVVIRPIPLLTLWISEGLTRASS